MGIRRTRVGLATLALLTLAAPAIGAEAYIYPQKGQSEATQEKDRYECYGWAKKQSGFDPMAPPTTSTPPPPQGGPSPVGGAVRGGAAGAAVGAVGGAVAGGKAGKGAAIGAATGGLLGGMGTASRNAQSQSDRRRWEQQEAARYASARGEYNRAFAACMEGRGYTVR
jgi:hypothetical protein